MNAHQRRIRRRRIQRSAVAYQAEYYRLGKQMCEAIQRDDWHPKDIPGFVLEFNADDPTTFKGWTWCDYGAMPAIVPMSPRVMLDATEHFINVKEPHE